IDIPVEDIRLRTVDISPYYSGHADQDGLVDFVFATDGRVNGDAAPPEARVFINHGNPAARQALKQAIEARRLERRTGDRVVGAVELPEIGPQVFDFLQCEWITVDETRTTDQLLEALLKEQMKTNDLLRQLLRVGAETGAKKTFAPGKPKKPSAT
ncbi:MAG TPA: MBL fold metallo-hydrolase RNA specificity domain-containing protein, partial [Burkholderiaceae bacterium]|nr:MBL fold metallo-hydrolase RNA specificity domain-containing protein [Burkholderiaceae bacterium]HNB44431.1 MBL fold metallo-hydrolase RNA specificity domain-containing protein [Burkholderiaceae bacterium]